ncbi:MAG TPA: ATP-binding protein [Acidobacteriaceae bacterium]|nr:ATP-binding protein [Acidobacteriaceae bacterium]
MLTLYQRLVLGCLLLIAVVTGVSLLVRDSFVELAGLDASRHRADVALSSLDAVRASLAREELTAAQSNSEPWFRRELPELTRRTQNLLGTAAIAVNEFDPMIPVSSLEAEHARIVANSREDFSLLASQLEHMNTELEQAYTALKKSHDEVAAGLQSRQEWLRARLISICGLSIAVAIVIAALMTFFVITPIRQTARVARRIGQNDLQQRVEWRHKDDLGAIATELNRLLLKLRELSDSEAGRLQMEHHLSDAVVQSMFEPVIVTDSRGGVLKLNQAAMELLGAGPANRTVLANTPGGEKILSAVRMAVSMQRATAGEAEAALLPIQIGKAKRTYRVRTTPMRDSDAKLLGAVTVLEDVTELQEVDRFKTRFLSVASQKLRDPLTRLRTALYALSRGHGGELRPLQSELVTGAEQEVEQMTDLMADLIEIGELETGRREMKLERIRPIDALRDAVTRHRDEAYKKRIDLNIRAFEDLPPVEADRRALRNILDNLLTNAVHFTPSGGSVLVEATELKDAIQFFVRDTGRGIEPERLPGIFGRFSGSAGEGDAAGAILGTGLGLALVRRLTELLGGQVSVESRMGQGSIFSFTLPMASAVEGRHPVEIG